MGIPSIQEQIVSHSAQHSYHSTFKNEQLPYTLGTTYTPKNIIEPYTFTDLSVGVLLQVSNEVVPSSKMICHDLKISSIRIFGAHHGFGK